MDSFTFYIDISFKFPEIPEDSYYITQDGLVYSKKSARFLMSSVNGHGYSRVSLRTTSKTDKEFRTHKLVSKIFLSKPPDPKKSIINHKDCNKANPALSNLEYVSNSENVIHAIINNRTSNTINIELLVSILEDLEEISNDHSIETITKKEVIALLDNKLTLFQLTGILYKNTYPTIQENFDFERLKAIISSNNGRQQVFRRKLNSSQLVELKNKLEDGSLSIKEIASYFRVEGGLIRKIIKSDRYFENVLNLDKEKIFNNYKHFKRT